MVGMTAAAPARAPRRTPWGDARFFLGILLIVASVAGVWVVVSAARETAPVFAATHTIVPGETVTRSDLEVVEVALGQVGDAYVTPDALVDGMVATRTITEGELVPTGAIGDAAKSRTTSVVLRSAVDVPASVEAGTVVEVWSAPLLEQGQYDVPRILVADATVVSVTRDDSMIGGGSASLELVIPRADVAATLAAMAGDAALSVVPTAGAAG
jgi:hypothetical protein